MKYFHFYCLLISLLIFLLTQGKIRQPPLILAQEIPTADFIENLLVDGMEKGIKGDYQGAIAVFTQVLRYDPQEIEAYYNRGVAYAKLKQWEKAIADFNNTLKFQPNYAEAYVQRSEIYLILNQPEKAIEDLQIALKLFEEQENKVAVQWVFNKLKEILDKTSVVILE